MPLLEVVVDGSGQLVAGLVQSKATGGHGGAALTDLADGDAVEVLALLRA